MTYKYEVVETPFGGSAIIRTDETNVIVVIPVDEANADYQAYLDRDKPKAALSTPIVNAD